MTDRVLIEVCCGSVDDAVLAQAGMADRVELNSALFLGGLTPSPAAITLTKEKLDIPVMVMIRPRPGGFCYSDNEMATMIADTRFAVQHGADGIVFGCLMPDGTVDVERCKLLIDHIGDRQAVFHRAFDVIADPFEAMEQLIELGVNRVLTSGCKPTADEGTELISELIKQAGNRIEILPGAGIREHNVKQVLEQTGASQIHISASSTRYDRSTQNNPAIKFGGGPYPPENQYKAVNADSLMNFFNIANETTKRDRSDN